MICATAEPMSVRPPALWRLRLRGRRLLHDNEGARVIELQAQGLAGLSAYADRAARIHFGARLTLEGMFNRDGRLHLVVDEAAIGEADLAAFDLELLDAAK
jgi:hypothetical protein